jgi:hypothetical protein
VLAAVAALAGCSRTGLALGPTTVSECYRSIPTALEATNDPKARLYGVKRAKLAELRKRLPAVLTQTDAGNDPTICAVTVLGPFRPGEVTDAAPGAAGRYAVVLVDAGDLQVLGSWVTDRLPRDFKGRTV